MQRLIAAVAFAMCCLSVSAFAATEMEIVVGACSVLSGPNARTGREQLRGVELWIDETNTHGGLLGKKLKLVQCDDNANPETSMRLYEQLIVQDKADFLIGSYGIEVAFAAAAVANRYAKPIIVPGPAPEDLWNKGYRNVFGLSTPATSYMSDVLEFARRKDLRRIAIVYQDSAFPRELASGIKAKAAALGLRVVLEQTYEKEAADFAPVIAKLKIKHPDVIIVGSYVPDSIAFLRQLKEQKIWARIIAFTGGASSSEFGNTLVLDAEGVLGGTPWEPMLKTNGVADFVRRFKTKYGYEPTYLAAAGYGAGQLLEAAAKRAGSVEADRLRRALSELDTSTVFGRYKVDANGRQVGKPSLIVQWINGERELVLPDDVATSKIAYPFKDWGRR